MFQIVFHDSSISFWGALIENRDATSNSSTGSETFAGAQ